MVSSIYEGSKTVGDSESWRLVVHWDHLRTVEGVHTTRTGIPELFRDLVIGDERGKVRLVLHLIHNLDPENGNAVVALVVSEKRSSIERCRH